MWDHRYPYIKLSKQDEEKYVKGTDGLAWSTYGLAVSTEDVVDWALTRMLEHEREILFVTEKEAWTGTGPISLHDWKVGGLLAIEHGQTAVREDQEGRMGLPV